MIQATRPETSFNEASDALVNALHYHAHQAESWAEYGVNECEGHITDARPYTVFCDGSCVVDRAASHRRTVTRVHAALSALHSSEYADAQLRYANQSATRRIHGD